MTVLGCDVAKWQGRQGRPKWTAIIATGVHFVFAKCTHGVGKDPDPEFLHNWNDTKGLTYEDPVLGEDGFPVVEADGVTPLVVVRPFRRGAYHWFVPNQDPRVQAERFVQELTAAGYTDEDLPPAVDVEDDSGGTVKGQQLLTALEIFISEVEQTLHRRMVVYTGKWFWKASVGLDSAFIASRALWHAQYTSAQYPDIPEPWESRGFKYVFWQFDGDKGKRFPDGTDADFNRFNGTEEDLVAFIAGSKLLPPPQALSEAPPEWQPQEHPWTVLPELFTAA